MFIKKLKELFTIYFAFFKVGAFTFGGGLAMMPMLQKELTILLRENLSFLWCCDTSF